MIMRIWFLDHHPAFHCIDIQDYDDHERLTFDGQPLSDRWVPPIVSSELKENPSDFLDCHNGALLLSLRAKELLEKHIHPDEAEFLPLEHEGELYYYMHVLNVVSCIDEENTPEERARNKEFEFHENLAAPHHIMRVKGNKSNYVVPYPFVSDYIHNIIIQSELQGYQMVESWDSTYSWKQKEADFQQMVQEVNRSLITTFTYEKAVNYVKQNNMTVYNGKWAMRLNKDGELLLGNLLLDGSYSWMIPMYIPPVLLYEVWGIKDPNRRASLGTRLRKYFASTEPK